MCHYNVSLKCVSFLIALLLLYGCAAMGLAKFDKAANTHIKKIALLRVDEPKIQISGPPKWYYNPLLLGGGIVGSYLSYYTIVAPSMKKQNEVFLKAKDENFMFFGPAMVSALQQELTKIGYNFIYQENMSPNMVKDVQTNADANLILYMSAGYSARKKAFKPNVFVSCILYDSRSRKAIYSRSIQVAERVGGGITISNAIQMLPDEKYKYNSFEQLIKNFDEAARGIIDCQNKIAVRIAEDLK